MAETVTHEYQWSKKSDRNEWTLHMFPFFLIIEHRPREPLPYVGSLKGGLCTLRDFHAWATPEEAAKGMVEWGLEELSKSYHELMKLKGV
jgi:hypothetical protein